MGTPNVARLGTPDMKPVIVGGPSALGTAKGGAIEFLLSVYRQIIYQAGARQQLAEAEADMKALRARIARDLAADPLKGVMVSMMFIVLGKGDAFRYVGYRYGRGATPSEALSDQTRHGNIRPGTRSNEKYAYKPLWYPPPNPTARYRRPFAVAARGCFVKGRARLQKVKWTTLQGFDDEWTWKDKLPKSGGSYRFDILVPPDSIVTSHGATGPVRLPIVRRMVGAGGKAIKVVNLNTTMPGDVTAAMVFPADITTEVDFAKLPETGQSPLGTIRGIVNLRLIRWVRPENIQLL